MSFRSVPPVRAAEWPDTLPSFYRSEAFAEDLLELVAPLPQWRESAAMGRAQGVRDGRSVAPGQGLRRRAGGDDAVPGRLGWQGA